MIAIAKNFLRKLHRLILFFLLINVAACKTKTSENVNGLHFSMLTSGETNIDFNNKVTESDSVNFFTNEYMYIGAGVGIGDFNNDGLQDIFFCGSQTSSKLYINKGDFKFEDVSESAGIDTKAWCLGASVIDINNDGFQDIYISVSQSPKGEQRKNLLYINKGNLKFKEEAADYGLADTGFSTQAVFFDYDNDGDLDMYLLSHRLYNPHPNNLAPADTSGKSPAEDKLYRNDGVPAGKTHPVFTDVTAAAGIKEDGYGLGVVVADINKDGWQDVYVANDYIGNDLLWLNNKNGTFTNIIGTATHHESYNSMGVDAADINNDALADISVLDMAPETNEKKKTMFMSSGQEKYYMERRLNYQPSFTRNMLQLNNGIRKIDNRHEPFFSEIGQLAGVSETDWSWSVLLADFDNDGWKDMNVTNGIARDLTNSDFVSYKQSTEDHSYSFGGAENAASGNKEDVLKNLASYGSAERKNYFFLNNKDLTFRNITDSVGLDKLSVSQGAAYADLDNDGDLDLVINNMNQPAFVCRNDLRKNAKDITHNFLTVSLKGDKNNESGIGAKITLYSNGNMQYVEQSPVRGYLSTVDNRLHFGVGNATSVDSLRIVWPDGKAQLMRNIKVNQNVSLRKENASRNFIETDAETNTFYTEISKDINVNFKHAEAVYFDFANERVLPQKYSQLGPCIATADINKDGLEDFFVGGAAGQSGKLFLQKTDGTFTSKNLVPGSKSEEDLAAVFFDADEDNDADLLITGVSTEFGFDSVKNSPRLYTNDGKGNFTLNKNALPANITTISAAVIVGDYDNDGDLDIFIGGRVVFGKYPQFPRSYILQNNKGVFTDVTSNVCPALKNPGMITCAVWTDFDNDKKTDLVISGEWMPVRFFKNKNGKLDEITNSSGLTNMNGLWRSLLPVDIDKDGDIDYVAGNMGINNKYHMSKERPMKLYAKDIDKNGYTDLIPAYFIKDDEGKYALFPGIDRSQLAEEVPAIKKKYLLYEDFAKVTMPQLIEDYGKDGWTELKCETMESMWIENLGNDKFKAHPLPVQAQFAPLNTAVADDIDNDGNTDLIIAGNEYQADIFTGRYDASYGLILKGNGKGKFTPVNVVKSGFIIDGDVKDMKVITTKARGKVILAAVNDDQIKCFSLNKKQSIR